MGGTVVESVPGGLLDRLGEREERVALRPVWSAAAVGAYARAQLEVAGLPPDDPPAMAWRHFLWHGCWLSLPDGGARPMPQVIDKVAEMPPRPRKDTIGRGTDWVIGRLLTDLRDTRAVLSPQNLAVAPELTLGVVDSAMESIDEARALGMAGVLSGHFDLLAADLAARANQRDLAEKYWQSAWLRFNDVGDIRGQAAAMVVHGDLQGATTGSPVGWNCVLATEPSSPHNALADAVELVEFEAAPARIAAAAKAYDAAAVRYELAGDRAGLACVALRRGYLAVTAGDADAALMLIAEAREAFRVLGRPLDHAVATIHLALAKVAGNLLPEDMLLADEVVTAARVIGHASVLGLGLLCTRMGRHWSGGDRQPERGRAAFALAERIWSGLGEKFLGAQAWVDLAEIAARLGDTSAARIGIQRALDADAEPLAQPPDPTDTRRARRALLTTSLFTVANQIRDVEGMERASSALHETLEPLRAGMRSFSQLGKTMATHLLSLADLPGLRVAGLVYQARSAQDAGDTQRASELFRQAHAVIKLAPIDGRDFDEAIVRQYEGDNSGASEAFERYVQQALASPRTSDQEARMLHVQGLQFQLTVLNPKRARGHLDQLTRAEPWSIGFGPEWQHLAMEGRLLELENDLDSAADTMARAVAEIESTRATLRRDEQKVSFYGSSGVQHIYLDAARVALKLADRAVALRDQFACDHWSAVAFGYGERARARALLDLMMANASVENAGLPADLVNRWRSSSARVALAQDRLANAGQRDISTVDDVTRLRAELDEAISRLQDIEAELHYENPRFAEVVNPQAMVSSLKQVASSLQPGTTLVQFMVSRHELLAWAVTPDGMVGRHHSVGYHGIERLVAAVLTGCTGHQDFAEPARLLAEKLLGPFRAIIDAGSALVFVPSGPTMRLPFAVLPWKTTTLGLAYPTAVMPSASAIHLAPERTDKGNALVVGNPAGMTYQPEQDGNEVALGALPGAGREAAAIAGMIDGSKLLTGSAATKEQVRELLPGARVAHFATHGLLDPRTPLASSIALASGEHLTMAELAGDRLTAELVVLSACHTGTGETVSGDELLGLGRVLLASGARSAIVTLWAVNDRSAALLMSEFHRRRVDGETHAQALRSACVYLRGLDHASADADYRRLHNNDDVDAHDRDRARNISGWSSQSQPFSHPYHWAPFVLISAD